MCGGGKFVGKRFPSGLPIAGVIIRDQEGHIFYPAYNTGGLEEARAMARRIHSDEKIVYSGTPLQVQSTIKNLNLTHRLKGYSPLKDFDYVRSCIT
jgi:hypothetical protein